MRCHLAHECTMRRRRLCPNVTCALMAVLYDSVVSMQAPRIDPESLEQENDRSIDALGERTNLLRQVARLLVPSQPCTSLRVPRYAASSVGFADGNVRLALTLCPVVCRSPMASSQRSTASTACSMAWCVAWRCCSSAQASLQCCHLSVTTCSLCVHILRLRVS